MKKLSVIVPCYNAERTIEKCVNSIINSTYPNIEIILVNDGSEDLTENIIQKFSADHTNIYAYTKENEGLGRTRNFGIKHASGELITFIDADDYIDANAYEAMISQMDSDSSDVVYCGFKYVYPDRTAVDDFNCKSTYLNPEEFLQYILGDSKCYAGISACTGIYKSNIIQEMNEPFYSEKEYLSEDKLYNFRYIQLSSSISIVSNRFYYYVQHDEGSITTTFKEYKIQAAYNLCAYMMAICNNESIKKLICYDFIVNLSACFQMLFKDRRVTQIDRKRIISEVINNRDFIDIIQNIDAKALSLKFLLFRVMLIKKMGKLIGLTFFINSRR